MKGFVMTPAVEWLESGIGGCSPVIDPNGFNTDFASLERDHETEYRGDCGRCRPTPGPGSVIDGCECEFCVRCRRVAPPETHRLIIIEPED